MASMVRPAGHWPGLRVLICVVSVGTGLAVVGDWPDCVSRPVTPGSPLQAVWA